MQYTHHYDSPLGGITLASDGEALIGLWFDGQKYFADTLSEAHEEKALPIFAQAVGGAVGHNSISLIIPCHRVVGTNGSLTGYAGGIDKKIALLQMEKADMSTFFIPKKGTAL